MKKILFILFVILALAVILPLSFNNAQVVSFDYLFDKIDLPLSWLIFGAFILGVLLALPFFALTGWGWKIRARRLQKQVDELISKRKKDEIAKQFAEEKQADNSL